MPVRRAAAAALDEWFSPAVGWRLVPAQWRRRDDAEAVFLNRRVGGLSARRPGRWCKQYGGGPGSRALAARAAPLVRDAPARPRRRPARRAGDARARLDLDHAGVHEGQPGAAVRRVPRRPPAGAGMKISTCRAASPRRSRRSRHRPRTSSGPSGGSWRRARAVAALSAADRRHAILVARRFPERRPGRRRQKLPARCSTTPARSPRGSVPSPTSSRPSSGRGPSLPAVPRPRAARRPAGRGGRFRPGHRRADRGPRSGRRGPPGR